MFQKLKLLSLALSGASLLTIAGCGGSDETPAPTSISLTGTVVVDQAIRNAIVCIDLNANDTCDTSEPVSAKTGADGAYTITYDSTQVSAEQILKSHLISPMVPGSITDPAVTIDATDTTVANTTRPFVLRQTLGKSGQINPLTTLVATGVAQGMTEAVSRTNVATQLGIAEAKIDNYQDDPLFSHSHVQDNARMMAKITAGALEAGSPLIVGDQTAAVSASAGSLANLRYTDAANYSVRTLDPLSKSTGNSPVLLSDTRSGKTNGAPSTESQLYTQAYLSSAGWVYCNAAIHLPASQGNPNRSTYCNTQVSVGFSNASDISGQTMSNVLGAMQSDPLTNTINNGISTTALMTALGAATFPADATIQHRYGVNLTQTIFINNTNTDGVASSITSLEQLITNFPSSAVNLATGRGTLSLGLGSSDSKTLRSAFTGTSSPTTGTVQYYECDLNSTQTVASNCMEIQSGTYTISTVGGVRVLRYADQPNTAMNHVRMHAEVKNVPGITSDERVYIARETKPTLEFSQTESKRLNASAWSAMKLLLGL